MIDYLKRLERYVERRDRKQRELEYILSLDFRIKIALGRAK